MQTYTHYSGLKCEVNGLDFVEEDQPEDQQKWIINNTPSTFKLEKYSFRKDNSNPPQIYLQTSINIPRVASVSRKRIFIAPNVLNKPLLRIPPDERTTDFKIDKSYSHSDSIKFSVPEGLYPETIPANVHITNPFGQYHAEFFFDNGKITYIRNLIINEGRFPANSYKEYGLFFKEIIKADNVRLVLLSKT